MDPTFTFSMVDVLCISLSLNALYFLQLLTTRLTHCLLPLLAKRSSRWRTLHRLHTKWPDLLGRLLMEQLSLFALLVLVFINLVFVSSVVPPFSPHQDKCGALDNEKNNNLLLYHQITRVLLSASTARSILMAIGILSNSNRNLIPIRVVSTNTRNTHIDMLYCLFGIASNIIGLGYKQNLLLLVTSSFMELNTTPLVTCRLIKLADRHRCCRSYIRTSVLCCAVFMFSSVLLPVLFLCHALFEETPFVMSRVPLIWFFVSAGFYTVFHSIFMLYSIKRVMKAYAYASEKGTHSCSDHEPFSVNNPDRLMNDLCKDSLNFTIEKDANFDSDELPCEYKPTAALKDLNYGFLAPYDNKNLCSFVSAVEEEKINFLQKKKISKNELMCRFSWHSNMYDERESNSDASSQGARGGDDMLLGIAHSGANPTGINVSS